MKKIVLYIALCVAMLGVAACSEDGGSTESTTTAANFVTYEGMLAEGSVSTFTYTDSVGDLITLTANWSAPSTLEIGQRMLIIYTAEEYGVSTAIELYGISALPGGDIKYSESVPVSEAMSRFAVSRSGNYLDFSAVIAFSGDAQEISLYVTDPEADVPTLYFVVRAQSTAIDAAERVLYASWNLESIAGLANKSAVNVVFTNIANSQQTITVENYLMQTFTPNTNVE